MLKSFRIVRTLLKCSPLLLRLHSRFLSVGCSVRERHCLVRPGPRWHSARSQDCLSAEGVGGLGRRVCTAAPVSEPVGEPQGRAERREREGEQRGASSCSCLSGREAALKGSSFSWTRRIRGEKREITGTGAAGSLARQDRAESSLSSLAGQSRH